MNSTYGNNEFKQQSIQEKIVESNRNKKMSFINSIRVNNDESEIHRIKRTLDSNGINGANAHELTKNLTDDQNKELTKLYKEESDIIRAQIEMYKNKIIEIKNKKNSQ